MHRTLYERGDSGGVAVTVVVARKTKMKTCNLR